MGKKAKDMSAEERWKKIEDSLYSDWVSSKNDPATSVKLTPGTLSTTLVLTDADKYPKPNLLVGGDKKISYKYNEDKLLEEIRQYINNTYGEHYSRNKFQSTEFIIDCGHGTGFNIGNMMKYTQRYGRKDTPDEWRKDLMKVIHYAIMQLYVHDLEYKKD